MRHPVAYMPLGTYPDSLPDDAILTGLAFARALGHGLQVSTFGVDIPQLGSALSGFVINVPDLVRQAEALSLAAAKHQSALVLGAQDKDLAVQLTAHRLVLGAMQEVAASEARYFDLSIQPWTAQSVTASELVQALVFGSGRPVLVVPNGAAPRPLDHIAIAWDESRVAARVLGDALRLLPPKGRVSVLTVRGDKKLGDDIAETLVAALSRRGYEARAVTFSLDGKSIAAALQDRALKEGAGLLAMGGFGHSRLRDFVLGGATQGVMQDLRLPVLLAH